MFGSGGRLAQFWGTPKARKQDNQSAALLQALLVGRETRIMVKLTFESLARTDVLEQARQAWQRDRAVLPLVRALGPVFPPHEALLHGHEVMGRPMPAAAHCSRLEAWARRALRRGAGADQLWSMRPVVQTIPPEARLAVTRLLPAWRDSPAAGALKAIRAEASLGLGWGLAIAAAIGGPGPAYATRLEALARRRGRAGSEEWWLDGLASRPCRQMARPAALRRGLPGAVAAAKAQHRLAGMRATSPSPVEPAACAEEVLRKVQAAVAAVEASEQHYAQLVNGELAELDESGMACEWRLECSGPGLGLIEPVEWQQGLAMVLDSSAKLVLNQPPVELEPGEQRVVIRFVASPGSVERLVRLSKMSPLEWAAHQLESEMERENTDAARAIEQAGPPTRTDQSRQRLAAITDDAPELEARLAGVDLTEAGADWLLAASVMGSCQALGCLLEARVLPDQPHNGISALVAAGLAGQSAAVAVLLEAGADPALELSGLSPLAAAAVGGSCEAVQAVLDKAGPAGVPGALSAAACAGQVRACAAGLKRGQAETVELLAAQADESATRAALLAGGWAGQRAAVRALQKHGARLDGATGLALAGAIGCGLGQARGRVCGRNAAGESLLKELCPRRWEPAELSPELRRISAEEAGLVPLVQLQLEQKVKNWH